MGQGGADEDWDEDEDEDERGDEVFAERSFIPGQETVHHAPSIPVVGSDKSDAGPSSSDSISDAPAPPRSILAASAAQGSALPSARSGMNTTMHRGRFGAFLRSLEAEREGEEDARARRAEREFDRREEAAKEEFEDSESDEEDGEARVTVRRVQETRGQSRDEMERVIEAFEKRLLELFLDGLDVSHLSQPTLTPRVARSLLHSPHRASPTRPSTLQTPPCSRPTSSPRRTPRTAISTRRRRVPHLRSMRARRVSSARRSGASASRRYLLPTDLRSPKGSTTIEGPCRPSGEAGGPKRTRETTYREHKHLGFLLPTSAWISKRLLASHFSAVTL